MMMMDSLSVTVTTQISGLKSGMNAGSSSRSDEGRKVNIERAAGQGGSVQQ